MDGLTRRTELAANLAEVRQRIADAALAAGRRAEDITCIAVTKNFPSSDIEHLHALGVRDFGENRAQEASTKAQELAHLDDVTWHFIGQLQTNKARLVARFAHVVHSVDRPALVAALARSERPLDVLLQVSIDGDTERGGVLCSDLAALAESIAEPLRLRGLMAVAPLGMDPASAFATLGAAHVRLLADHPQATMRCIGMSEDFPAAIAAGATHIRIGSALLGSRSTAR